jgi:N-acetylneuraminic acid mutarotase
MNDLKTMNTITKRWEKFQLLSERLDMIPQARMGHTAVTYKHYLVVYGGSGTFDNALKTRYCFPRVFMLNTNERIWETAMTKGEHPVPRRFHGASVIGHTMVIFGGQDSNGNLLNDVSCFDLETYFW